MTKLRNFLLFFAVQFIVLTNADDPVKPCNLLQYCEGHDGPNQGACADPGKVTVPYFPKGGYDPAVMTDKTGKDSFAVACPFMDVS